jgi:Fe-S-cluster containining protein
MNKSIYVDPNECKNCGLCCKSFQIGYSKESDKDMLSEVERFKLLDTDLIQVHEDTKGFWIEFRIPCKHLLTGDKGYYCEIYDKERPELCEKYPYKDTLDCPHKKRI